MVPEVAEVAPEVLGVEVPATVVLEGPETRPSYLPPKETTEATVLPPRLAEPAVEGERAKQVRPGREEAQVQSWVETGETAFLLASPEHRCFMEAEGEALLQVTVRPRTQTVLV